MKNILFIKILNNEIWLYKNGLIKEKTQIIIENNFIRNNKILQETIKKLIITYKLNTNIIQSKIYILINKLYCETNIFVLKNIMYNLGLTNYRLIFEEDLYS